MDILKELESRIANKEEIFKLLEEEGKRIVASNPKLSVSDPNMMKLGIIRKEVEIQLYGFLELLELYRGFGGLLNDEQTQMVDGRIKFVEFHHGMIEYKNLETLGSFVKDAQKFKDEQQPKRIITVDNFKR